MNSDLSLLHVHSCGPTISHYSLNTLLTMNFFQFEQGFLGLPTWLYSDLHNCRFEKVCPTRKRWNLIIFQNRTAIVPADYPVSAFPPTPNPLYRSYINIAYINLILCVYNENLLARGVELPSIALCGSRVLTSTPRIDLVRCSYAYEETNPLYWSTRAVLITFLSHTISLLTRVDWNRKTTWLPQSRVSFDVFVETLKRIVIFAATTNATLTFYSQMAVESYSGSIRRELKLLGLCRAGFHSPDCI